MQSIRVSLRCAALAAVALMFSSTAALATTVSPNTGSLGSTANGTNANAVTFTTGVVTGNPDNAAVYNNTDGVNTTVPYLSTLDPSSATAPFTVEFWANPVAEDGDSAAVSNRVSTGNRSGWAFFERTAAVGWNFRMYNGNANGLGVDITGGTATLNAWTQVVATWNGTTATLFVNGVAAGGANNGNGVYNPNTTQPLTIGTLPDQTSDFNGALDEVAYYGTALSAAQVAAHYAAVSSPTPGAYYSLVQADGAKLQLSNAVPEPTSLGLLGIAGLMSLRRRRNA